MPNRYPHFRGGSQKCSQSTPLVKARNGKIIKMLNLKFAWISDPAAYSMQTAVFTSEQGYFSSDFTCISFYTKAFKCQIQIPNSNLAEGPQRIRCSPLFPVFPRCALLRFKISFTISHQSSLQISLQNSRQHSFHNS